MKCSRLRTSPYRLLAPGLLALLAVCWASAFGLVSRVSAQAVTVSVVFLNATEGDATFGQSITRAKPGSKVRVVVNINVPDNIAGAKVDVNLTAQLKIAGVPISYNVPVTTATGSNTHPQDGGSLVQTGVETGTFKVPPATPAGSTIRAKAQATVLGVQSNVVLSKLTID